MMDAVRLPGFVWTALIVAATAGLQSLAGGLEGVSEWWAPLGVALVAAALKAIQEAMAKEQVIEIVGAPDGPVDGQRSLELQTLEQIELELPPFWVRFFLG